MLLKKELKMFSIILAFMIGSFCLSESFDCVSLYSTKLRKDVVLKNSFTSPVKLELTRNQGKRMVMKTIIFRGITV